MLRLILMLDSSDSYLRCNACIVVQEGDVRQLFAPFGQITSVSIMKDNNGQSQGYGYVEFSSMPDASKAMQQWDGQEVVGQKLSVKVANMGPASVMPQLDLDDDEGMSEGLSSASYCWQCTNTTFALAINRSCRRVSC